MLQTAVRAQRLFAETFGSPASVVAAAPGRVEVLGNHTDYNEGVVLSCAIDRTISVAVGPAGGNAFELVSTHYPTRLRVSTMAPLRGSDKWANYPLGVAATLRSRGLACPPCRIAVDGDVPLGSGLSSSAALEVSTCLALRELYGLTLSDTDAALVSQAAENTFVGAQCGLLDQFTSLFGREGHLLYIDFRSLEHRAVPVGDPGLRLVLTISGVTHSLAECPYNERREECRRAAAWFTAQRPQVKALRDVSMQELLSADGKPDATALRRARHVVGENERVVDGMALLQAGDLAAFGRLLFESHQSSRENFENSCPQLDRLVAIASSVKGVYGSRLSGGGFGGATLTLVAASSQLAYEQAVRASYRTPAGRVPDVYAARVAEGARVVVGLKGR